MMKVTIEVIAGNLIKRTIECDYYKITNGRYAFFIKKGGFDCDCGSCINMDECIGSYPESAIIILKTEAK